MAPDGDSGLVRFDGERALQAAQTEADGQLFAFAVYTTDEYDLLHVHDGLRAMYRDDEQMHSHFDTIHSYVHVDFTEQQLFEDELFPDVGRVRTLVTRMEDMAFVRILDDGQGVFLSVESDEPITKLVDAIETHL